MGWGNRFDELLEGRQGYFLVHGVNSPSVYKGLIFFPANTFKIYNEYWPQNSPCGDRTIIPKLQPHRSSRVPAWFAASS